MLSTLAILYNEIHKGLRLNWYYKFNALSEFVNHGFTFIGTLFLMNFGQIAHDQISSALLGYIFYVYALEILNSSQNFMLERKSGTLEQMYMSPEPSAIIFLGNMFATIIWNSIMIGSLTLILLFIFNVSIPFTFTAVPIFLLTITGLLGVGLGIAGIALIYKNIHGTINLTTNILFYVNGAMLPIEHFPEWLQNIANMLPTTQGIIVMREIVLEGQTVQETWHNGSLPMLIVHSSLYFLGGLLLFNFFERRAKQLGTVGQY